MIGSSLAAFTFLNFNIKFSSLVEYLTWKVRLTNHLVILTFMTLNNIHRLFFWNKYMFQPVLLSNIRAETIVTR